MPCYLGDSFFRTYKNGDDCTAEIVSDGKMGVEKFAFAIGNPTNIAILKTTSGCGAVGGGTLAVYEWLNGKWNLIFSSNSNVYAGYSAMNFWINTYGNSRWFKAVWEECTKLFKIGEPTDYPCTGISSAEIQFWSLSDNRGFAGYIIKLVHTEYSSLIYLKAADKDGRAVFTGICQGGYHVYLNNEYHGVQIIKEGSFFKYTLLLPVIPQPVNQEIAQQMITEAIGKEKSERITADQTETKERITADQTEATTRQAGDTTEATDRIAADKELDRKIIMERDNRTQAVNLLQTWVVQAFANMQANVILWVTKAFVEIVSKVLEQEKRT